MARSISPARVAEESIQKKAVVYDGDEDQHYDTISAFIKSMRGSDPDAAIYWLAKMLYAGEDIRFIARRIVICASEDVGMADPQALVLAVAAQQAVEFVGMPEAQIPLAHATIYIATAPKSNRAYAAIGKAMTEVKQGSDARRAEAPAGRALQVREKAGPRRGLPIRARSRGRFCAAGLPAGGAQLLRADGTRLRETGQGAAGLLAGPLPGGADGRRKLSAD